MFHVPEKANRLLEKERVYHTEGIRMTHVPLGIYDGFERSAEEEGVFGM